MNTAQMNALVSEIVDLASLSNLGIDESPIDKLVAIFHRAVEAKAMIDASYEAEYTELVRRYEERQDAQADLTSAGWGHD